MKRWMLAVLAAAVIAAPAVGSAQSRDCGSRKAQTCNPQQECLRQVDRSLKGEARERALKDCSRMPTTGNCYGGDIQSDCEEPKKKRR